MKVYTTKNALTTGIEVKEVIQGWEGATYVRVPDRGFSSEWYLMGRDAFLTYSKAAIAARAMRDKRQAFLKRQLVKVSGLLFPTARPLNLK